MAPNVGEIVGAALRIEQMRADDMRLAALESQQATEAPDVGRGNFHVRGAAFQCVFKEADRQVVTPAEHDGVDDVGARPQQLDVDLVAGIDALGELRDAQEAVGLHHRADHAGAACQRCGDNARADLTEGDSHELLQPQLRWNLARHDGAHRLPRRRRGAQEFRDQGPQDLLAHDDRGYRIPRQTEYRRSLHDTADCRLARHDIDAVHEDRAPTPEDADVVGVPPGGGAGNDRDDVVFVRRGTHRRRDLFRIVTHAWQAVRPAAPFGDESGDDTRIALDDCSRGRRIAGFNQFAARGDDRDAWPRRHADGGVAGRQQRADVERADAMPAREQRLRGDDV